jgi:anti-sigma regulatory factor (Ser/Thr protein kinase)
VTVHWLRDLTGEFGAVGAARHWVRSQDEFGGRGARDLEALLLVVSELVTNAIMHGRSPIAVSLVVVEPGCARIEVWDTGRERPRRVSGRDLFAGSGGWGLELVARLSSRWGVVERGAETIDTSGRPDSSGKYVWAEVPLGAPSGT